MHLHEYQAKRLLFDYGIPVPDGKACDNVEAALAYAQGRKHGAWMVKAQVHAGGRGKAGGIVRVEGAEDLAAAVADMLGNRLVTHQTTSEGQLIRQVLIETPTAIAGEYYLGLLVDRDRERVAIIASPDGGMDIEAVAASRPERIIRVPVDIAVGLQGYQCRRIGFFLGLDGAQRKQLTEILKGLYRLFTERDLGLVEINPLAMDAGGALLALDAKINVDDNGLARQPALAALDDPSQEDPKETRAKAFDLNYIALDGNIACMVNGAGLAMATMDLIKLHGGNPANFLDVGGGTTAERVSEAFKLILSDSKVKAILVNIFGGIVRCDLIAEGIIQAVREVGIEIPVVVRLEGTNVEQGLALLDASGLALISAEDLTDAARRVVEAAR